MLLVLLLYTSFLLVWFVYMDRRSNEGNREFLGNFISAANMDETKWNYLHAHEDLELRTEIPFAELEMEFLHQNNNSSDREDQTITDAEAHAKTLKPYPVSETKIRRLRCIGWRATDNCSPDGPRIPRFDEPCNKVITFGASGYCEVQDKDTGENFKVMQRHCSSVRDTARFRCSESWDFAVFPQKAREAVEKAHDHNFMLPNISPKLDHLQEPRDGIVMVVYPKLLASAYATIRALRELLNCHLPIELWFRSQEMKFFPEAFTQLQEWSSETKGSITFREIGEPGVVGFATKVFAIYHSFFERVLFLDADNVPVRDPTFLFASPEFQETGAVFWPDFWHPSKTIFNIQPHSLIWELLDLPYVSMFEQESGQLLVDRRRHAVPLELVKFYIFHRPNHFDKMKLAHGDKDLFRWGLRST
ncbi:Hypothetical protein PHPALM_13634 [Phytophthora palmivora]|uniref:Uncharacterized protein n=1 Tax=Phytophthora palmivora TaxID=4796 RepID=A0A2P4XWT9_9STRA|nr:Hypothetical protein PHPALM_13634 [Phytophthora palmivora]